MILNHSGARRKEPEIREKRQLERKAGWFLLENHPACLYPGPRENATRCEFISDFMIQEGRVLPWPSRRMGFQIPWRVRIDSVQREKASFHIDGELHIDREREQAGFVRFLFVIDFSPLFEPARVKQVGVVEKQTGAILLLNITAALLLVETTDDSKSHHKHSFPSPA
jgi:hypothetical protein